MRMTGLRLRVKANGSKTTAGRRKPKHKFGESKIQMTTNRIGFENDDATQEKDMVHLLVDLTAPSTTDNSADFRYNCVEEDDLTTAALILFNLSRQIQPTQLEAVRSPLLADKHPIGGQVNPNALVGVSLAMEEDRKMLNSLHCFVRKDLLELFTEESHDDESSCDSSSPRKSSGRVGLRCVHCCHEIRKERDSGAAFFPRSIRDIYRSVCAWQRIHFQICRHVPSQVKELYWELKRTDKTRGKTSYWIESAKRLGLTDDESDNERDVLERREDDSDLSPKREMQGIRFRNTYVNDNGFDRCENVVVSGGFAYNSSISYLNTE